MGESASVTFQPIYKVLAIFLKLDIGMGTQLSDVTVQSSCV